MIKKYRKKPVIIEAVQLTEKNKDSVYAWAKQFRGVSADFEKGKPVLGIYTLEGKMTARIGDYIIRGVADEIYPCRPDIFEQIYELVQDGEGGNDGRE